MTAEEVEMEFWKLQEEEDREYIRAFGHTRSPSMIHLKKMKELATEYPDKKYIDLLSILLRELATHARKQLDKRKTSVKEETGPMNGVGTG